MHAVSHRGAERNRLVDLAESPAMLEISAFAWYEFSRGPRTPEHLAVARTFFLDDGVIPFSEDIASAAADIFRALGSPRKRAGDIAIGTTALVLGATLLTLNERDFRDIPGLTVECPGTA